MNKILLIAFTFIFVLGNVFAKIDNKPAYFLAKANFYLDDVKISSSKASSAALYAIALSEKYYYINDSKRDSVYDAIKAEGKDPTVANIGHRLNADFALFINVNQSANILRLDLTAVDLNRDSLKYSGVGWSLLKFASKKGDTIIVDPSLLEAFQRAFADMLREPNLFANQSGILKISPKSPMAICAINYIENENSDKWTTFKNRITDSYDALENIFEYFYDSSSQYLPIDIESRDFIYQKYNLMGVENYSAPTKLEFSYLNKMGIKNFIFGEYDFKDDKIILTLFLCEMENDKLSVKKTATGEITTDEIDDCRKLVKRLSAELDK